jgi:hypothetical protein
MLDYPNPFSLPDPEFVFVSQETLAFLDTTLTEHAGHMEHSSLLEQTLT